MNKNRQKITRWGVIGLRIFLGCIFIYASWDKILHPAAFAEAIYNYQILPEALINVSALVLPWLEFFLGICMIMGIWLPGAVFMINLLLLVFFGALLYNFARGLNVQCGCFGSGGTIEEGGTMAWYAVRDLLFLSCGVTLLVFVYRRDRTDQGSLGQG